MIETVRKKRKKNVIYYLLAGGWLLALRYSSRDTTHVN